MDLGPLPEAAEKCSKAGFPFGMPLGHRPTRSTGLAPYSHPWLGARRPRRQRHGQIRRDKQALEWFKKLVPFLPPDVFAWDDASNNKWLISGKAR